MLHDVVGVHLVSGRRSLVESVHLGHVEGGGLNQRSCWKVDLVVNVRDSIVADIPPVVDLGVPGVSVLDGPLGDTVTYCTETVLVRIGVSLTSIRTITAFWSWHFRIEL